VTKGLFGEDIVALIVPLFCLSGSFGNLFGYAVDTLLLSRLGSD
jgi:hypothetical protein